MNTKKNKSYGALNLISVIAVIIALAFTALSLAGCPAEEPEPEHVHDWNTEKEVISTVSETTNGAKAITCKLDKSHIKDGTIEVFEWATGSAGLTFSDTANGGRYVHKGEFTGTTLHIPAYHRYNKDSEYKLVTEFYPYAFRDCTNITAVTFATESQLTTIGEEVFFGCNGITSITIPASVTSIGDQAFHRCTSLKTVIFAEGSQLETIGGFAFWACTSLTGITIPDSVTSIGDQAFESCTSLASITLSASLTTIGNSAFASCTSLESITIPTNQHFRVQEDILYSATAVIFVLPAISGSVTIPNGITTINGLAFLGCKNMTAITLPATLTTIGKEAFWGCLALTTITIPAGVTEIGEDPFHNCNGLTGITVEEDNPNYASEGGILYNKAKTQMLFVPANLTSLILPEGITEITTNLLTFSGRITNLSIPASVTAIEEDALRNCHELTSITVHANNQNYESDNNILYNKGKTVIMFVPRTISGSVTLPNTVTTIGGGAFNNCQNMTGISIPASVTEIDSYAFVNCTSLTSLTVDSGNQNYESDNNVLYNKGKTELLLVLAGTSGVFTIPDSVTTIGWNAFFKCTKITSITIPTGVTTIGNQAFLGWTAEQTINVAGHANQAAADVAWQLYGNPSWRDSCNATIKYQGEF